MQFATDTLSACVCATSPEWAWREPSMAAIACVLVIALSSLTALGRSSRMMIFVPDVGFVLILGCGANFVAVTCYEKHYGE